MIRWKSLKSTILFCGICLILLLLNKRIVEVRDSNEKEVANDHGENKRNNKSTNECDLTNNLESGKLWKSSNKAKCSANSGKEMTCMHDGNEYYFPFSFIKKQYDVSGKLSKDGSRFELFTSYSKIRIPEGDFYDPIGPFGHFATYSVETRERVRCISAATGVPMSTQWNSTPYYYPIQIAQYGLQHYSRMKANRSVGEEITKGLESTEWKGSAAMHETSERIFYIDSKKGNIVNITTTGDLVSAGCYVFLDPSPRHLVLSFEWLPIKNASFTILVRILESDTLVLLNYVTENDSRCVWSDSVSIAGAEQMSFSYFLGRLPKQWHTVTRDLLVDVSRALSSMNTSRKKDGNVVMHTGDVKLVSLGFRGTVSVRQEIRQAEDAHRKFFLTAAEWLSRNQDDQGGWAVPVERTIADRRLTLEAGWYSAMAQDASNGGVKNMLFDHVWFEEYPTTPGSFVLNGFMYSLIGLYDFKSVQLDGETSNDIKRGLEQAALLYSKGMESLRALLPLYDTGSGSLYDLRHVGLHTAPNLARWDYHAVHVYLLKWLVQISGDKILNDTADRWIDYSWGKKAKHN
ncbi:D-glucuronyl C5-epimerase [Dictyocaulus viviparus]|uniref:heparosan-N-sulfate-glucuronate 5-epimerase n=1 Tax=Dictyocaulus viviparus TaxID=29172 RepID=A0A0D8YA25_DICVI|nr:D-glucuronyl C5-epimerase [Dictyocaulus viviparus]